MSNGTWAYPKVRRDESIVEELHGIKVADPYRWLEDPDSEETKSFVNSQNALTFEYLESFPHREKFRESLTKMYDYEKHGTPFKYGNNYYYFYNSGLQPQPVLYQLKNSLDAPRVEFFNPNTLEADGTAALNTYQFSEHGKYFGYGISKSGSDWQTFYVKSTSNDDVNDRLDDVVEWVKYFSFGWTHDEAGFFYTRYPEPDRSGDDKGTETDKNLNSMLYYHKLGTKQSEDILIYKDPKNPEHMFTAEISSDGRYVLIYVAKDCEPVNKLWLVDLEKTNGEIKNNIEIVKFIDSFEARYHYITNKGTTFYFNTNSNAPLYKVVKYDLDKPEKGFVDVIKEHSTDVLVCALVADKTNLVVIYMHDVKEKISIYELLTGKFIKDLPIPIGNVNGIKGDEKRSELFFKVGSFLNPGIIYRYDFSNDEFSIYKETQVHGLDSEKFEARQVFVESKDKTKIPAFIVSLKNLNYNGNNPTLLYGYGGFNKSITPSFSVSWLNFIQHYNGVIVVANIRGGSEYGEEWHQGGMLHNKQNSFDDFQYIAKWLIDNKITKPQKLAINGGSNGGLLVGACVNQKPELFGAAVADVGVMDMLRYHKFTIGYGWKSDYGDPDVKEDFEYLYKYSPLHNVQSAKPYPAILLTTSDHDDRVVPLHSHKFIAELQHTAKNNPKPLMTRIDMKIDEYVDKFSFIGLSLNLEWVD
ncbi:10713_t:CDS:10 [Entrophospora sp. SA101]|nr:10713_t:CDS:10 [Entrophospora sp. SA101]